MNSDVNPLVVRVGAFGDVVMISPVLEALARRCGRPCDVVAAGSYSYALFDDCPWVGRVFVLKSRRTPYWLSRGQQRLVAELRRRGWGPTWVLEDLPKATSLMLRAGCPREALVRIGEVPDGGGLHDCERNWEAAKLTPAVFDLPPLSRDEPSSLRCRLHVGQQRLEDCRRWLAGWGWRGEPLSTVQIGNKNS